MGKWIEQTGLKRSTNSYYIHEEIFNILRHKGNANQNDTEILSHPSQNFYYQENKQ
jgi:hypothetical protein